jgi:hypothetical protein
MVKRDSPSILIEKWEYLDERTLDGHQIKVTGQEFFTFAAFGNLLFTPEEVEFVVNNRIAKEKKCANK